MARSLKFLFVLFLVLVFFSIFDLLSDKLPIEVEAQETDIPWSMAGANPQRTGWTPETIPENIDVEWAKPIEPLVSPKVQPIGAEDKIFVTSAKGLYAFDEGGNQLWVYPTEMPIDHSATYHNGVVYIAGFDRRIHAVNASNGQGIWTYDSGAAFDVNPLAANGKIYAGDRDGVMHAVNTNGSLAWKYQTGNQIRHSAAYKGENDGIAGTSHGIIIFGSNDGYAYALNADNGNLVWQSDANPATPQKDKLPGMGWRSWWPVVYQDYVVFTRTAFEKGQVTRESHWVFTTPVSGELPGVQVNEPGDWVNGEFTLDVSTNPNGGTIPDYFEAYPHRRSAFFLDRITGQEVQFDIDNDGITDASPVMYAGDAGTRYPPTVVEGGEPGDQDDVVYFRSLTHSSASGAFPGNSILGWKVGTPLISFPTSEMAGQSGYWAGDEQTGISSAGNKLYWTWINDRFTGAADITQPNTTFPDNNPSRQWRYVYGTKNPPAGSMPEGYAREIEKFFWKPFENPPSPASFWGEHDTVGPMIYNSKMYVIMANALVAFSENGLGENAPVFDTAPTVSPGTQPSLPSQVEVLSRLENEVQKIVELGQHLKPSFTHLGLMTTKTDSSLDDFTTHYWHNPADLHYVLLRARPYLSPSLKQELDTYLQSEFAAFSPATYSHVGWVDGTQRDPYAYPPADSVSPITNFHFGPKTGSGFSGWGSPPQNVYAIWKYAAAGLGDSSSLFSQIQNKLKTPITANKPVLDDTYLSSRPHVHNAYIAGYKGYVELAKLAQQPPSVYVDHEAELNRLLQLRTQNFITYPFHSEEYFYTLITAWNFMYMTPELAAHFKSTIPNQVQATIAEYEARAPFWMFALNSETQGENAMMPYQQTHALFQAKALVLDQPFDQLAKSLDSPIVPIGDLYYIDNLVSTLEMPSPPSSIPGDANNDGLVDGQDYIIWLNNYGEPTGNGATDGDFNGDGMVNGQDYVVWLNNYSG